MPKKRYNLNEDDLSEDFDDEGIDYPDELETPSNRSKIAPHPISDDDYGLDDDFGSNPDDLGDGIDDNYNYDIGDSGADFAGGGVSTMEKHGDLLKDLTNFDPFLKKKMYEWMGYSWDDEKGKYVLDKTIDPLLNYKGGKRIISILGTYARGNNIITHLDNRAYNELIGDLVESMCYSIGPDMKEYGIQSNSKFLLLLNDVEASVKLVLQGAGGGKYSDFLKTTVQRSESFSGQMPNGMIQQPVKQAGLLTKTRDILLGR